MPDNLFYVDGVKVGEIEDEMTQNSIMKAIAGGDKDE